MHLKKPLIIGSILTLAGAGLMYFNYDNTNFNLAVEGHKLKTVDVRKQSETFNQNEIENLKLNVKDQQINVREGDSDKWVIKTVSYDGKRPSVDVENKTLTVTANNMGTNFVMTPGNGELHFSSSAYDESAGNAMTIIAPKGTQIKDINVTGRDGGIILDHLKAKQTKIKLADGGARINKLKGQTLKMTSEDGRLHLENADLKQMQVTGEDMDIDGSGLTLKTASQVKLADGSFSMDRVHVPGFNLETDGDISFNQNDEDNQSLKRGNQENALLIRGDDADFTLSEHKGLPEDGYDDEN